MALSNAQLNYHAILPIKSQSYHPIPEVSMAVLEQLIYGSIAGGEAGRELHASSPGLDAACCDEIVRLCEGWGAVPSGGLRRPVLLSFPLQSRVKTVPGEAYVVIRISEGLRPVFHAAVIGSRDYQEFDHNPFALALEEVFLDQWKPGASIEARVVSPGVLSPLVAPPPSPTDVGGVDEAVRQMLANERLLLPLEIPTSQSDRFLALTISALPRSLKRQLRLASWAPSGANRYSLAATYREQALFTSWQPFLMTSIVGELDDRIDSYLEDLRRCLANGDLAGIERVSGDCHLEPGRVSSQRIRIRERTVAATLDEESSRKLCERREGAARKTPPKPVSDRGRRRAVITAVASGARSTGPRPAAGSRPDSPHRLRRTSGRGRPRGSGPARRGFAVALSLLIVLSGAYYFWTTDHWARLPGLATSGSVLDARTGQGVVDVGAVYRAARAGVQRGQAGGAATNRENQRQLGLDLLRQAGQLLDAQGRNFLQDGDHALEGGIRRGLAPAPAVGLQERGRVLARELRRLAMARVSLRDRVDWQDLDNLEDRPLAARYDSLVAHRRLPGHGEPDLAEIDDLLRRLEVTTNQVSGLAHVEALLEQDRWDDGWSNALQRTVDELAAVRQGRAQQLRGDAEVLARLKRAEHTSDLAGQAFDTGWDQGSSLTPAVADILPALFRQVEAREYAAIPPLLLDTAELYSSLTEASAGQISPTRLADLVSSLEVNRAHRFDPEVYGDHVARLRFMRFEQLVADRVPPDSLVTFVGSEAGVEQRLQFSSVLHGQPTTAEWVALRERLDDPFLLRWSSQEMARLDEQRATARAKRERMCASLRTGREQLRRLVAAGGRGGEAWNQLAQEARSLALLAAADDSAGEAASLASYFDAPPPLMLDGFTVRLGPTALGGPEQVVVSWQAGAAVYTSAPVAIGPAAPTGTGWVGTGAVDWSLALEVDEPVLVTVRTVADERILATFSGRWLSDWDPQDLVGLESEQGVRLACRLSTPYWSQLP